MATTYEKLLEIRDRHGAGFLALLDPDSGGKEDLVAAARTAEGAGADAVLIGGSFLFSADFDRVVREVKRAVQVPVVIFPADITMISPAADALLYLSLVSGRNPELLIGQQVKAAPILRAYGLEAIATGYILVESGRQTTVEYVSNTRPVPRRKPDIALAHALASEYLGMKCVYLDAGSGADAMVPGDMVRAVSRALSIPLIVGGGIRTPEDAAAQVAAGADFVVIGTALEAHADVELARGFAGAIHSD